jgi:transcriptional regulator with XRE-family HTH domain
MADSADEAQFNDAYLSRVKALREAKGFTAERMAILLGVPPDRYRKYETRSPLPVYLVERFAALVDSDVHFVVTGRKAPVKIISAADDAKRRA